MDSIQCLLLEAFQQVVLTYTPNSSFYTAQSIPFLQVYIILKLDSTIYWFSHSCSEPSRLANEGGSIRDESRHVRTWSGFIWRSLTISMRQRRLHECTLWLTCSSSKSGSSKYKFAKSFHWFLPIEIKGNPWHNRFRVPSVPWLLHSLEKQCPII